MYALINTKVILNTRKCECKITLNTILLLTFRRLKTIYYTALVRKRLYTIFRT